MCLHSVSSSSVEDVAEIIRRKFGRLAPEQVFQGEDWAVPDRKGDLAHRETKEYR
jgi:hypothetical protein